MNHWIFQGNPKKYDINVYLKSEIYIYWRAAQHASKMEIGDDVFIWRSHSKEFPRGIIASGIICEKASRKDKVEHPDAMGSDLWKIPPKRESLAVGIKLQELRLTLENGMIPANIIKRDETLSKMLIMRAPQRTNFLLEKNEYAILKELWEINSDNNKHYADEEISFPEGRLKFVLHCRRERNISLRKEAIEKFKRANKGKVFCEMCGFSFERKYGELGKNFIEVHHIKPISKMKDGDKTKISDLKMLCANCHRMAHRDNGWEHLEKIFYDL